MGQAQIASIKYFRSFRFGVTPEDRVKYCIKLGGKNEGVKLVGEFELLNISLSGFAFDSDQILEPDCKVCLEIKLGKNTYQFHGLVLRASRHREKRGFFTYGVKNLKEKTLDEKVFIEDLISQFKARRLRKELVNLLVNEIPLEDPKREDVLGLLIGLFSDLRPFDDRGEFLELFMLQSKKVMQCEHVALYLFSKSEEIKLLYPFQMAGRRSFPITNTVFEKMQRSPKAHLILSAKQLQSDAFYQNIPRLEGRVYKEILLTPILNEDHEVVGLFECANLSQNVMEEISFFEQYATLIGFLCADLCEKFTTVIPDNIFRESRFSQKKKNLVLIGESTHAREIRAFIQRKKSDRQSYLVLGHPGTGKELLARIVHDESADAKMPLGVVDVRDWDAQISLKEVFCGDNEKVGKLELYSGGTLILKNIDLLTGAQQEELLDIWQDKYSICIVGTSHLKLSELKTYLNQDFLNYFGVFEEGEVSKSLRLMVITNLKDRENDLTYICQFFLFEECQKAGLNSKVLSDKVLQSFYQYDWPNNMFELKTAIARAVHAFQSHHVIDEIPREIVPLFGLCQHQVSTFEQVILASESEEQDNSSLLKNYQNKLCEMMLKKYGSAQEARKHLQLTMEEWVEWTELAKPIELGKQAA